MVVKGGAGIQENLNVCGNFQASGIGTFGSHLKVGGNVDITGNVDIDDTTQSTSTTTGAIKIDGGAGIAKNLYIGGGAWVQGSSGLTVTNTIASDGQAAVSRTATGVIASIGDGGASGDRCIQFKRSARDANINLQAINSGSQATTLNLNQEGGDVSVGGNLDVKGSR